METNKRKERELSKTMLSINEVTSERSSRVLHITWEVYHKGLGMLSLTFKGNKVYQYNKVPRELAHEMLNAQSIGKFFDEHINKKYPYRKAGEVNFHE